MVIITGGAGFIGSCVAKKLCNDHEIIIVDDFDNSLKWKNIRNKDIFDIWTGDEFYDKLKDTIPNCNAIIHLGAVTSTIETNMGLLLNKNFLASKKIYNYCLRENVRLIYASSAAVYGRATDGFSEHSKKSPQNPYGLSKLLFDQWVEKQPRLKQCVGLRFFNVYGPNEYHKGLMASVVLHFYEEIIKNGYVNIFKSYSDDIPDGEAMRDFIYVKDIVNVIEFFLNNDSLSGIFNVGTQKSRTYNELANIIFNELNIPTNIQYIDMPPEVKKGYQYITQSDNSNLVKIGYNNEFTTLESGIHDYLNNYLINKQYY